MRRLTSSYLYCTLRFTLPIWTLMSMLLFVTIACNPTEEKLGTGTDTSVSSDGQVENSDSTTQELSSSIEPVVIDLTAIPPLDVSKYSIPIKDIYFDTFRPMDRAVPLSDASSQLISSLLDAIPPIYNPIFESVEKADLWLSNDDLVLGYTDKNEAYAYPVKILNFHEIVSQTVNGRPILVTYCPLCRSGIVYDRVINGEALLFGNTSALYESGMVMLDHKTGSYWVHVSGEAVVGTLTGSRLALLPSQTTTWGKWKEQHPLALSLSRNTGHPRDYSRDPFVSYVELLNRTGRFFFPVSDAVKDDRLPPGEIVLGVEIGDAVAAYAVGRIGDGVVNDSVNGESLVVFSASEGPTGAAYSPLVNGETLTFVWEDKVIRDEETGSVWTFAGQAVEGELRGVQLIRLPVRSTLWFALIASTPDLLIR